MDATDVSDGLYSLRRRAGEIEETLRADAATRLAEWSKEETQVKDYIKALADSRNIMRKEHTRLQAEQAASLAAAEKKAAASAKEEAAPGIPLGFNPIRAVKGKDGEAVHETELHSELQRLKAQMKAIDASIAAARSQLENLKKEDERTVWETNIVILKDTRRMHAEEAGLIELELTGRERMRKEAEEHARAEDSGAVAAAQMAQQIASVEARLDALKQRLYFPPIKGFSFAQGSNGIYFGGKDFMLSELSGSFGLSAEVVPSTVKGEEGQQVARLSMRVGSSAAAPAKGGEGSAKPGKESFLRRSYRSSASAGSKAGPPQSKSSDSKPSQPQDWQAMPEPLPGSASPTHPPQQSDAGQQLRRHTEGSQAEAAPAPDSSSSSAQAYGRSGSFSAAGRQAVHVVEQRLQVTRGRAASLGMGLSTSGNDQRRTFSANEDPRAPVGQWKGNDEDDYMRAKPSQGKKLAFGFLSRVGNKDKYAKRLDKLKQGVLQGNSDLNGSMQHGGGQTEQKRPNLATRFLPKRAQSMELSFGKHHLRSSSQRERSQQREVRPPPTVLEEDAQHYSEAPRETVIISSNPHSCSSRARPLPSGQGADSVNLLFRSPFDRDPEPPPSGHGGPVTEQGTISPGAPPSQQPEDGQAPSAAADKPKAAWKNPFEVPEMMEYSSAASQQAGADLAAPSPHAPRSPHKFSSNPFEDPPDQEPAADDESEEELQPELAVGAGELEGDDSDTDSVQEAVLDPGMGHLIAGGFGGSESIGVSSSPMPTPKKPPPAARTMASVRTGTSQGSGAMDSASTSASGRAGLWVVLRLSDVGLVGERGSKVPNASIGELSLEIEVALALSFEFASAAGWRPAGKPRFEVVNLQRTLKNSTVPMPKTLLRMILNATLPRLIQRALLVALPPELGQYLLACKQGIHIAGEAGIVGPALSCFDVDLSAAFQPGTAPKSTSEAKRMAQQQATAQEARSMLGISADQAGLLDALFAGPEALVEPARPCSISELQTLHMRCAHLPAAWEALCAVWDVGLRTMGKFRGMTAPSFIALLDSVAMLQRKPVRARLTLTRVDVAVGVDSALLAMRNYCERAAKELHAAGGRILARDGRAPPSLQQQLEGLQAWHAFLTTRLQVFKGKFRRASVGLVAAADCNSISVGMDSGHYEGPLRMRLPVKLSPGASAEGAWSFDIPLPDPTSQKLLSRLIGGLKAALNSPAALVRSPSKAPLPHQLHKPSEAEGRRLKVSHVVGLNSATELPGSEQQSQEVLNADSSNGDGHSSSPEGQSPAAEHPLLQQPPLEWFGPLAEELLALQPQKLGKITVNGLRIRVRLDEGRITELLKGLDGHATTTAGLLNCIGDLATISFAPHMAEEEGQDEYLLALESSDMANLCADVAALGFLGGPGVTPGRLLRVAHALTRVALMTLSGDVGLLQRADKEFNAVYEHLIREALDASLCVEASAATDKESKEMVVHVKSGSEDAWPLALTNEVDLASLLTSP